MTSGAAPKSELASRLLDALPQTQCTRCAFVDCASYADAMAQGEADINRCPPGGAEGIRRLSALTGRPARPLDPAHGTEAPRSIAFVNEEWCIGCTLCISACPTDAIIGSPKRMHTVIEAYCTGCELCLPVCPVDCIALENVSGNASGWGAWSASAAQQARQRYEARTQRVKRTQLAAQTPTEPHAAPTVPADNRRNTIDAAIARARSRRESAQASGLGAADQASAL